MKREYLGIMIDDARDDYLTVMAKETLADRYAVLKDNDEKETFQEIFARPAVFYSDNLEHAQRLYDYISNQWFMPATPILSNGGTSRGLPISCFLNSVSDSLEGIWDSYRENMRLSSLGGGIGTYWNNLRAIGESIEKNGKKIGETSGVISFMKIQDAQTTAVAQGGVRRGSAAVYLKIDHPEVEEFLTMRRPTGGDENRKCLNLNHGIVITDEFMDAVAKDEVWYFISPKTGKRLTNNFGEYRCIKARELWAKILDTRMETGEPYLLFIDTVKKYTPEWHAREGLFATTSNLCSEIVLPVSNERTAVCCLSSFNLEKYNEWANDERFIKDVHRFLDNVLTSFIEKASVYPELAKAVYSASQERSIGLGVMGFHSFLQSVNVPFESDMARYWNIHIHRWIKRVLDISSMELAEEKGPCPDAAKYGFMERNTYKTAIAPTASISIFCQNTSPCIEPSAANAYTHKTLSGFFLVKNRALEALLEKKGYNTAEVWKHIINDKGSVSNLDFLTDHEKSVFRTAYEIDQNWIITHAADRAGYIDQAASTNLFFPADVSKEVLNKIHWDAWAKGLKSLYYCRSTGLRGSQDVSAKVERKKIEIEECEACQ